MLLESQRDRASASFHQWLTPERYADRFGLPRKTWRRFLGGSSPTA